MKPTDRGDRHRPEQTTCKARTTESWLKTTGGGPLESRSLHPPGLEEEGSHSCTSERWTWNCPSARTPADKHSRGTRRRQTCRPPGVVPLSLRASWKLRLRQKAFDNHGEELRSRDQAGSPLLKGACFIFWNGAKRRKGNPETELLKPTSLQYNWFLFCGDESVPWLPSHYGVGVVWGFEDGKKVAQQNIYVQ